MDLNEQELYAIEGGAIKIGIWTAVGGLITLLVGIIDGFIRPLACHK